MRDGKAIIQYKKLYAYQRGADGKPEIIPEEAEIVRRIYDQYLAGASLPMIKAALEAMQIGWTQNVVILEADLSLQDKAWYIQAVKRYGWSKAELLRRIESATHTEMTLDTTDEVCYTDSANTTSENKNHDEDTLCVFGKHLPQSNGRVCDEGSGKESRSVKTVPDRVSRNVCRRRASLSTCQRETVRTWDQLQRKIFPSAGQGRLRPIRPPDRHGQSQSCDDDHMFGSDPENKFHLLLDYTGHPRDIEDPWYTRDFETAWQDIEMGCCGLLRMLTESNSTHI